MSRVTSSFPNYHVIDPIDLAKNSNVKCLEWRLASRVRHTVSHARVLQQVASNKTCGSSPNFRAPTPHHLLLQGGHRRPLLDMEQHNCLPLGPGFQQLSISATDFKSRQPEEDHQDSCVHRSTMEGIRQAIATLSQVTSEVKVYLSRTYSAVCNIADQNKEQNTEFKYMHSRLSCVESRLDDIERNTIELLGKVDSIKEDLSVFISKTQYSQMQEAPFVNQGRMEAASFLQQNYR